MAGDGGRLYGRDRAITLVREFMDRPAQNRGRRVPIVVFTGSRGSGKTALLSDLARRLDQRVPYAYLDLETVDAPGTPEVLSALAFDLNRHCATYGRLAFPRLIVGRIAMAQDLDLTDHHRARSQVEAALEAYRNVSRLREFLRESAPRVLSAVTEPHGIPVATEAGRYVPGLLLDGLVSWAPTRRVVLGRGLAWYGHQDRGLARDSLDVLVDLNRRGRRSDLAENRAEVDELLMAAFVADLRDGFGATRRAARRPLNCVILLDNADTAMGLGFLVELVRARGQHAAHVADDADPVTVVVTSVCPPALAGVPDLLDASAGR